MARMIVRIIHFKKKIYLPCFFLTLVCITVQSAFVVLVLIVLLKRYGCKKEKLFSFPFPCFPSLCFSSTTLTTRKLYAMAECVQAAFFSETSLKLAPFHYLESESGEGAVLFF